MLVKELGLDSRTGNKTYVSLKEISEEKIIQEHVNKLNVALNLTVLEESKVLPHIYWLPKLHKNPTKLFFIIAAPDC